MEWDRIFLYGVSGEKKGWRRGIAKRGCPPLRKGEVQGEIPSRLKEIKAPEKEPCDGERDDEGAED